MIYDDLPRCCDCANRQWFEGRSNIFGKLKGGHWVCIIGRPLFDVKGVAFNTDPTQMRLTGPCGQEGKMFRPTAMLET